MIIYEPAKIYENTKTQLICISQFRTFVYFRKFVYFFTLQHLDNQSTTIIHLISSGYEADLVETLSSTQR